MNVRDVGFQTELNHNIGSSQSEQAGNSSSHHFGMSLWPDLEQSVDVITVAYVCDHSVI